MYFFYKCTFPITIKVLLKQTVMWQRHAIQSKQNSVVCQNSTFTQFVSSILCKYFSSRGGDKNPTSSLKAIILKSNKMSDRLARELTPIKDPIFKSAPASVLEPSIRRQQLGKWLGKTFRVVITDGRVLVGFFNCTDKDANVVLSVCAEYLEEGKDARILGNVMIPGKHIVSIAVDMPHEEALGTFSVGYANGPLNDGYETIKPLV